jgi:hypothetical protein
MSRSARLARERIITTEVLKLERRQALERSRRPVEPKASAPGKRAH